jgi:hypothetical protein
MVWRPLLWSYLVYGSSVHSFCQRLHQNISLRLQKSCFVLSCQTRLCQYRGGGSRLICIYLNVPVLTPRLHWRKAASHYSDNVVICGVFVYRYRQQKRAKYVPCVWEVGEAFIDRPYEVEDRTETHVSSRRRRFADNRNDDFSARKKEVNQHDYTSRNFKC